MFYSNSLNLIQVGGGTQVKQGDLGSKFSYKLANEKDQELDVFDKEVAHINLVLDDKIVFTTTATVDNSTVTFNIDKAIPVGLYFLEIKIRDYIFPSDKQTIIFVQSGAVAYDLKELVPNYDVNMTLKGILSDLSQKGIDISDLKTKMNAIYNNALADHAEVADARGTEATLGDRLRKMDGNISQTSTDIERTESRIDGLIANAGNGTVPSELTDMRVALDGQTYATAGEAVRKQFARSLRGLKQVSTSAGIVAPYDDLNTLPANTVVTYAYYTGVSNTPTGMAAGGYTVMTVSYAANAYPGTFQLLVHPESETYIRIKWGNEATWKPWEKIVTEESITTIPAVNKSVKGLKKISTSAGIVAPYDDLNTLPVNTIVLYTYFDGVSNAPAGVKWGATVVTYNHASGTDISGAVQILTAPNGDIYTRNFWGLPGTDEWKPWKRMATEHDFNPSLALFEKIGVIGDSYASGEIYPEGIPDDKYSISWGQILARKNGVSCTNFSAGGLTTRHWLLNKNGLTKLNATEPQNLYYISLGINDKNNLGIDYIGTEADMDSGADTYYGNYAKIINAIKAKAPHAKIILIDSAWSTGKTDPYYIATKNIATKFGLPLIKHSDDPYLASQQFKKDLMSHGHPVAISYAAMASAFERLTMQAIRDNIAYFKDYRG